MNRTLKSMSPAQNSFLYLAKYWAGFCASAEMCLCAPVVLFMANWPDSYVFLFASGIPAMAG